MFERKTEFRSQITENRRQRLEDRCQVTHLRLTASPRQAEVRRQNSELMDLGKNSTNLNLFY
jgi:hypothetical protein